VAPKWGVSGETKKKRRKCGDAEVIKGDGGGGKAIFGEVGGGERLMGRGKMKTQEADKKESQRGAAESCGERRWGGGKCGGGGGKGGERVLDGRESNRKMGNLGNREGNVGGGVTKKKKKNRFSKDQKGGGKGDKQPYQK